MADVPVASPTENLLTVMDRLGSRIARVVVLDAASRVIGVVTPTDIAHMLHTAVLRYVAARQGRQDSSVARR